jgi:hypothetical protein
MRVKRVFIEVEALQARKEPCHVSARSLELHVRAVGRSVRTANPTFISDAGLDAIAPGHVSTMAAVELCLAGLWHRTTTGYGGYIIDDPDLVDRMAEIRTLRRFKAAFRRFWRGSRA